MDGCIVHQPRLRVCELNRLPVAFSRSRSRDPRAFNGTSRLISMLPRAAVTRAQQLLSRLAKVLPRESLPVHPDVELYEEFGQPEDITLPPPKLVSSSNRQWIADNLALWKASWPRPFVCVVQDVRLLGRLFLGVTRSGEVILETTRTAGSYDLLWAKITRQTLRNYFSMRNSDQSFAQGFWAPLFHVSQDSYFHWLTDVLPTLEAIRVFESCSGSRVRFIVSRPLSGWQRETLELLGVQDEDVFCWNGTSVQVKRLVVPSVRTDGWTCLPSIVGLRWVRDQMLLAVDATAAFRAPFAANAPHHIYIRRAGRRRIENEDEVVALMASRGIVAVDPEAMTVAEQIRLFRGAALIVGSHGAGLTNMIFSDRARIIELFGPWKSLCYSAIAIGFGHDYSGIDLMPSVGFQRGDVGRSLNFRADIDSLRLGLDSALANARV